MNKLIEKISKKSFKFKIIATYIIGLSIIGILGYGYFFFTQYAQMQKQIESQRNNLLQMHKYMARTAVEVAQNIISIAQNLAMEGKVTLQDAKEIALDGISTIKYGKVGYVWCMTYGGTMLLDPPKPSIEGKNIFKLPEKPYKILKEILETLRIKNGDFIEYEWYYPSGEKNKVYKKISYVKSIPSFKWIIGSGFYLKDIDDAVEAYKEKQQKAFIENAIKSLIPGVLFSVISFLVVYILIIKMMRSVEKIADVSKKLIEDEISIHMKLPTSSTEGPVGKLVSNINNYIENTTRLLKFKEDIDLCETEEEIFLLIADLLKNEFKLNNFSVYKEKDSNLIPVIKEGKIMCGYTQKCLKAVRRGVILNEKCPNNQEYVCYPIFSGDSLMGAIEMVLNSNISTNATMKKVINRFIQSIAHSLNIKRLTQTLKELSLKDKLTGLYNRRFLEEIIPTILSTAKRLNSKIAVVMIDLDDFKKINDTYGHLAGDEVLKFVANSLKNHFKRSSDLIVRYGGEEFLIIVESAEEEKLLELLKELKDELNNSGLKISGTTVKITASIGYAFIPDDAEDFNKALELADKAMYKAKR
ncbi:diguanylate cyclase [Hippea maritima]|uniref:diguanylate cyclase n=1 Tax=Hippea maritima (strain ATCC 700847 / DSM 10411 / MH2) TaxID=760142 RepID=F2LUH2_HIPMA|nr:diguanylate cyclase [Hippea maritima]AEA33498.1 diguanylate cyclase [Hippea maritima DSM 10411]